jgi:hypothetical protein
VVEHVEKYVGDKLVYVGNKNVGDIFAILCYFSWYNSGEACAKLIPHVFFVNVTKKLSGHKSTRHFDYFMLAFPV